MKRVVVHDCSLRKRQIYTISQNSSELILSIIFDQEILVDSSPSSIVMVGKLVMIMVVVDFNIGNGPQRCREPNIYQMTQESIGTYFIRLMHNKASLICVCVSVSIMNMHTCIPPHTQARVHVCKYILICLQLLLELIATSPSNYTQMF